MDDKARFGDGELALDPYTGDQGVFELDADLVERARSVAAGVELSQPADQSGERPVVTGGVNLCGDELWHGAALAEQVGWLLDERGVGTYRATEMEDAGTASALARFGQLDRYLTVRGISNHDRPTDDGDPAESLFDPAFESGFGVAAENAVGVAGAVLEHVCDWS